MGPILLDDHGSLSAGASLVWAWFPHYAAPVLPLLYGAVAIALRRLGLVRGSWLPPRSIRPAMLVGVVLMVVIVNHGESIAADLRQGFISGAGPVFDRPYDSTFQCARILTKPIGDAPCLRSL